MARINLYDINAEIERLMCSIEAEAEENEGIIPDHFAVSLDGIEMIREEKIINLARIIKNETALHAALKVEKARIAGRMSALQGRIDSMKKYLSDNMQLGENITDETVVVKKKENAESVVLGDSFNVLSLPELYQNQTVTPKKNELKAALKLGQVFDGVTLERKISINIK